MALIDEQQDARYRPPTDEASGLVGWKGQHEALKYESGGIGQVPVNEINVPGGNMPGQLRQPTQPFSPPPGTPGIAAPEYNPYPAGEFPQFQPAPAAPVQMDAEKATEMGLGAAHGLLTTAMGKTYDMPADITGQIQGPQQYGMNPFIAGPQLGQTDVSGFQGTQMGAQFNQMDPTALRAAYDKMQAGPAQQLMGGDYDVLQQALMLPGQQELQRGYDQSQTNLKNVMGGKGLYGSSMMGNQMVESGRQFSEGLASNAAQAAAQRYGMQQQDLQNLNQYNLQSTGMNIGQEQFGTKQLQDLFTGNTQRGLTQQLESAKFGLAQDQMGVEQASDAADHAIRQAQVQQMEAQNQYGAGMDESQRQQQYGSTQLQFQMGQDEAQRGFQNQQLKDQFNYQMSSQQWEQQLQEMLMNQSLALAGKGAPLASAQMAAQSQLAAAEQQRAADENAALWGVIGTVGGQAAPTIMDWAGKGASKFWDWAT